MPRIVPNLWFDANAKEAAEFYVSVFPSSRINDVILYTESGPGEPGTVVTVDFELDGQRYTAINGGPEFPFTEAVSLLVSCQDQAEVDSYWEQLGTGGEFGPCGWLEDRYGLSWQIVPVGMEEYLTDANPQRANAAMGAMLSMGKIDLAAIEAAANAVPVS